MVHLLTRCRATSDTRDRIMPDLFNILANFIPNNRLLISPAHDLLTQFLLDCSSLNLPVDVRVPPNHPGFTSITRQCSSLIYAVNMEISRQLKAMGLLH